MFLAVDIGNSNTVIGLYQDGKLHESWRIQSRAQETEDECIVTLNNLLAMAGVGMRELKAMAISSTVPVLVNTWQHLCEKYLHFSPLVVSAKCADLMPVLLDNRQEIGADRLVNVYGGLKKYGAPLIIVDMGTATTFDCVSAKGEYQGGVIAPGISISSDALFSRTAKLPRVEFKVPKTAMGHNTIEALQSGIVLGFAGQIDGLVKRLKTEMDPGVQVIATGGLSTLVSPVTETIEIVDPLLTLDGLLYIYQHVQEQGSE